MNRGFLPDTNIPSELMRARPEPKVQDRVAAQDVGTLFMSVVSIGELETGFATTRDVARTARLEASLERYLALLFVGRVLPVTQAIAVRWGMIAATALEHGLTLVTRNVKHFAALGVDLLNPWLDS